MGNKMCIKVLLQSYLHACNYTKNMAVQDILKITNFIGSWVYKPA